MKWNQTSMTDNKKPIIWFFNFLGDSVLFFHDGNKILIVSKYLRLIVILFHDLIKIKFMHIFNKIYVWISNLFWQYLNKTRVTKIITCKIQWAIILIIINIFKKPLVAYSYWRVHHDIMIKKIGLFIYYVQNLVLIHRKP